jgi:transcription elongation factor GreB
MKPRPAAAPGTALITTPGFAMLKAELRTLWEVRRPEVVRALAAAAAEGDRSENAEYIYRKKELAQIDRRVRFLSKRIPALKPHSGAPADPSKVRFGAWVTLDDGGTAVCYRIVGPDETDATTGWISIDSPVARALIGKAVGDHVELATPAGVRALDVQSVRYDPVSAEPSEALLP